MGLHNTTAAVANSHAIGHGSDESDSTAQWFFLMGVVTQLECHLRQVCAQYSSSFLSQLLVLCSFAPTISYIIVMFLAFYDRTVFHLALTQGMFLNGIIVWLVSMAFDRLLEPMAIGCGRVRRIKPSPDAGIMWFVVFFIWIYEFSMCSLSEFVCTRSTQLFLLLLFASFSSIAQVQLHIFHQYEVLAAIAIALLSAAIVSMILQALVIPWMTDSPCFRRICRWCSVYLEHPRYSLRPGFVLQPRGPPAKTVDSMAAEDAEFDQTAPTHKLLGRQHQQQLRREFQ